VAGAVAVNHKNKYKSGDSAAVSANSASKPGIILVPLVRLHSTKSNMSAMTDMVLQRCNDPL